MYKLYRTDIVGDVSSIIVFVVWDFECYFRAAYSYVSQSLVRQS